MAAWRGCALHGEAVPDAKRISRGEIDLVAVENGGSVVTSSDQFFGEPRNLLMPYAPKNMGDGWETRRRRGPGHDWVILKLGVPGAIRRVEVDTAHFKGNFPDSCSLEACHAAMARPTTFLAAPACVERAFAANETSRRTIVTFSTN